MLVLGPDIGILIDPVFIHKRKTQSNFLIYPILPNDSNNVDNLITA